MITGLKVFRARFGLRAVVALIAATHLIQVSPARADDATRPTLPEEALAICSTPKLPDESQASPTHRSDDRPREHTTLLSSKCCRPPQSSIRRAGEKNGGVFWLRHGPLLSTSELGLKPGHIGQVDIGVTINIKAVAAREQQSAIGT